MANTLVTGICASVGLMLSVGSMARPCEKASDFWPFEVKQGGENSEILFYADLYLERSCTSIMAEAKAGSTGTLYGISADLVEAKASATLQNRRAIILEGDVTVLGYVVDDFRYTEQTSISIGDRLAFPLELDDSQTFMVGPVPVAVDYGLVGEGGLNYNATLSVGAIDLDATPYVESKVFAATGLDILIAEVKAYGEVTLINDTFRNQFSLALDQVNFDKIYFDAYGWNQLNALDGRIAMTAKTKVIGFERTYNQDLVNWNGYARQDEAFRVELDYPIAL
ncbi:hypothetical protein [Pseudobacteriovorax antillogorgiicola]|uniref:Uncharacterized protein n=1 Tax=Pseudobacteriovorax antillogorgiicola TaxID=1513793 RepID=A0A1Y6C8D9_9BACT|nr:hypothetical protein [Pseudobacteriovorax antillogorgiicola]TCS51670.1 hypothetical protein EDD56_11055 [Pseudobacteriovorax antillogorgiicola]SMF48972.1 hypothetical protein SAMN06296036_11524 [Pseudobacteriovorax antillogorgiicola]